VCRPHLAGFIQEPLQELVREKELVVEVQNSEFAPIKMSHVPVRQHSIIDLQGTSQQLITGLWVKEM
jgi:hypothetical protein